MEQFAFNHPPRHRPFDEVSPAIRRRAFGVDYLHLRGRQSGDLYITRHGWAALGSIVPSQWFTGDRLSKVGRQLAGATGAVHWMPVPHQANNRFALVIKFSRFAQEALVSMDPKEIGDWGQRDRMEAPEFLSPFVEFGNLESLRASAGARIPTQTPLAIYSPATRYLDWELGRISHSRWRYDRALADDQASQPEDARIAYGWERLYILLYRWIDGMDAEVAAQQGHLSDTELVALTQRTRQDLRAFGWDVLDHKPRHVIVRTRGEPPRLMQRGDHIPWALIDYELLMPYPATAG
jgi:hypothetical protein